MHWRHGIPLLLRRRRVVISLITIILVMFYITKQNGPSFTSSHRGSPSSRSQTIRDSGANLWRHLEHLFVFGDSYSQTFFDHLGTKPSLENPFGNPDDIPNSHFLGGPRYPVYLTTSYNATPIMTYNYAVGGSTISRSIIPPQFNGVRTFEEQLHSAFWPYARLDSGYQSSTTMVAIFFGINDVINVFTSSKDGVKTEVEKEGVLDDIVNVWKKAVEKLMGDDAGFRYFIVSLVPPVQTAPLLGTPDRYQLGRLVKRMNKGIKEAVGDIRKEMAKKQKNGQGGGGRIWVFDTHGLMDSVYADHMQYAQSSGWLNLTSSCDVYKDVTALDMFEEECGVRLDQFMWWDQLHPTTKWHDLHAMKIVDDCFGYDNGRTASGFCEWG